MLPLEFILTDAHFAIGLLAAMACFATAWLYFDAWVKPRGLKELLKWVGFGTLAVGFVVMAVEVEPIFLSQSWFAGIGTVGLTLRGIGYAVLSVGLALDSLQPIPRMGGLDLKADPEKELEAQAAPQPAKSLQGGLAMGWPILQIALPLLAGLAAFLYWRRATKGLERHLKPVAWAFVWFTSFELLSLAAMWRRTDDPRLYDLVAPFGLFWIVTHLFLAVAAVILGRWVWQYLTRRVQTQLFMVLGVAGLTIFLVTTVSFTFLLMNRVQQSSFEALETTAKVLRTSVSAQQDKAVAAAEVVAQNPNVVAAVTTKDHQRLTDLLGDFLVNKKLSSLIVTADSAQVLLRAEEPSHWGDSISSDSLMARASVGKSTSGLAAADGALAPRLVMKATTPIRNASGVVVGAVTVGSTIDNAFVDGLKQSTGLASTIYSGPVRVATTLLAPDGTRSVGVRETRTDITRKVLEHNQTWSGLIATGGQPYLAVYAPLRDTDGVPVGMLFIGQSQVLLLQAVGSSIELTFLISVLLLLISVWPVHLISRSLARQLH